MRFLKSFFAIALTAVTTLSFAGSVADVLKLVPSTTELVIVTENVGTIETKLNTILSGFGVPADDIRISKLNELVSGKLGVDSFSISADKPVCFVFTNIMAANNSGALYVPVDDAQAVLDAADAEKKDNGIYVLDGAFAYVSGGYIVVGNNEFNLITIKGSKSSFIADDVVLNDMEDSDLTIYANLTNLMNVGRMMIPAVLMNVPQFQENADLMQSVQRLVQNLTYMQKLSISVDYNDGDIVTKSNIYAAPGSDLAGLFVSSEKIAMSDFYSFPDGNAISYTAASLPKSWISSIFDMVSDVSALSGMQGNGTEEYVKNVKMICDIMADYFKGLGDEFTDYVAVDYMVDIDKDRVQDRLVGLGRAGIKYDDMVQLWDKMYNADLSSLLKVNEYEPKAGEIDGVAYSHFDYDILQMAGNGQSFSTNYNIYTAYLDNIIAAGWSEEAFKHAITMAKSETKLSDSETLIIAKKYLPETANFYSIANMEGMGSLMFDNFKHQTEAVTEQSPELAGPLGVVSSVFESMSNFGGTVATSCEVNDGYVRFNCVCDKKMIDSIGNMVKSGISAFDGLQGGGQSGEQGSKEF